ncbi:Cardiolipin synthetase [Halanaerobium saccharolyticum subsp. saccharolyticum DSM 6643]|uniref:Cardiolipin synthase n=1 Tax=Halanaerobium saccharolyticum subsp. saccharolyticum DSM 6643 TaxID=1293054 RepID=M5E2S6_9FIRM|nr:cardiolipin synthase [Halanaerobium saccharolyticum]CCU79949.1 Cardiolipin synthetase [Halanaerobium saccharolyticum subsp. saccharolyticum DSM 6643]
MNFLSFIPTGIIILNIIFIILLIFFERKDPTATWAWLLILTLIPVLGFILYLFFGLTPKKRKVFQRKQQADTLNNKVQYVNFYLDQQKPFFDHLEQSIMRIAFKNELPSEMGYNKLKIYSNGKDKFKDLFHDLKNAKKFIHANYYIINDDQLGNKFMRILAKKAEEGVEVRLLYDKMGCRDLSRYTLFNLEDSGVEVVSFAPFVLDINYRNHRKNLIIDGEIGYLGGINIGDEYLGFSDRFGEWRDTHLKIIGESVKSQQYRFLLDWKFASGKDLLEEEKFFPESKVKGDSAIQIVSSGPDSREAEIKAMFLKMIYEAEKTIYIQTPYFIPDQSMLEALIIASRSGVDVKIMIPDRGDHPFVYAANNSFVGQLLDAGARCYRYTKGFLHSKTICIDSRVLSIGTTNMDVRSFKLNFEINAFVYDKEKAKYHDNLFKEDLEFSNEITKEEFENRGWTMKLRESVSRLLSPIL